MHKLIIFFARAHMRIPSQFVCGGFANFCSCESNLVDSSPAFLFFKICFIDLYIQVTNVACNIVHMC